MRKHHKKIFKELEIIKRCCMYSLLSKHSNKYVK
jgi:hypothetical protein